MRNLSMLCICIGIGAFSGAQGQTALFRGGSFDGHGSASLIRYVEPPAAADRFHGGTLDGHDGRELIRYTIPASALNRFRGGAFDGYDVRELITFDYATLVGKFHGGAFDGHSGKDAGPYPNPLDRDTDGDGLPDWWEVPYFDNLTGAIPGIDQDGDGQLTSDEYIADTDPNDVTSLFKILAITASGPANIQFRSSSIREYTFEYQTNLITGPWTQVPGVLERVGLDGADTFTDPTGTGRYYRLRVRIP